MSTSLNPSLSPFFTYFSIKKRGEAKHRIHKARLRTGTKTSAMCGTIFENDRIVGQSEHVVALDGTPCKICIKIKKAGNNG